MFSEVFELQRVDGEIVLEVGGRRLRRSETEVMRDISVQARTGR